MSELPASLRWKADDDNPFFEMPTLFDAVTLTLVVLVVEGGADAPSAEGCCKAKAPGSSWIQGLLSGATYPNRTDDLRFTKPLLYRLS